MEERTAAFHLVYEGLQSRTPSWVFVVLSPNSQGNTVAGRHDDARRPDLHVEGDHLCGRQGFQFIVRMRGPVFPAEPGIQLAVRCSVAAQNEFKARNAELPDNRRMVFRIGVNLGDVIEEKTTYPSISTLVPAQMLTR